MSERYEPNWNSLQTHPTPQWIKDAKFGIYAHWGVYSVPAFGPNGTWYPYRMYRDGTDQHAHHVKTYGLPSEFGYKDFIPMFTAEKFDPDEWAELFRQAGAQFAGPVAEHHDGFTMWDSAHTEWNAARMGPQRDVVGDLERAIRGQGMRFLVVLHHFENWWFFPHWSKDFDTSDPGFAGLYGPPHDIDGPPGEEFFDQTLPDRGFLELWKAKAYEVMDKYRPAQKADGRGLWNDSGRAVCPAITMGGWGWSERTDSNRRPSALEVLPWGASFIPGWRTAGSWGTAWEAYASTRYSIDRSIGPIGRVVGPPAVSEDDTIRSLR